MPAAWVYKSRELQPCEVCRLVLCEIVRAFTPDLQGFAAKGVGPEIYRVGTLWPGSCTPMRFARRAWVRRCPWLDQLEDDVEEQEEVGSGGTGLEVHNVSSRDKACPSSRRTGGSSRRLEGPGTALAGVQANVTERLGLQNDALPLDRRDLRQLLPKLPCLVIRG